MNLKCASTLLTCTIKDLATLKTFLEHGAITQTQHDKSLNYLTEKMGYADE